MATCCLRCRRNLRLITRPVTEIEFLEGLLRNLNLDKASLVYNAHHACNGQRPPLTVAKPSVRLTSAGSIAEEPESARVGLVSFSSWPKELTVATVEQPKSARVGFVSYASWPKDAPLFVSAAPSLRPAFIGSIARKQRLARVGFVSYVSWPKDAPLFVSHAR